MTEGFESVLVSGIKEAMNEPDSTYQVNALLKMLVEVRESAKMNDDFVAYERITDALEGLGVQLAEEVHVTARIKVD